MKTPPQSQKNKPSAQVMKTMGKMMNAKLSPTAPNATSKAGQKKMMSQDKYKKGM